MDVAHGRLRQPARPHDGAQLAPDQGYRGAFHRYVGTTAHGDANVGRGQRGRIVDAVTGHRHPTTFGAQCVHRRGLVGRRDVRMHFVDAQLARHRLCGGGVVAGQHHDAQAGRVQVGDRLWRIRLDPVGHRQQGGERAVDSQEHHRGAVPAQLLGASIGVVAERDAHLGQQFCVAQCHLAVTHFRADTAASQRAEIRRSQHRHAIGIGGSHDRPRQRMLARTLQRRSQRQQMFA